MDLTVLAILAIVAGFIFFVIPKMSKAEDDLMDEIDKLGKSIGEINQKITDINRELTRMEKEYAKIKQHKPELVDPFGDYMFDAIDLGV